MEFPKPNPPPRRSVVDLYFKPPPVPLSNRGFIPAPALLELMAEMAEEDHAMSLKPQPAAGAKIISFAGERARRQATATP